MGKHDARHTAGKAAGNNRGKKASRTLLWVLLGVVVIGAAAAVLFAAGAFRPEEAEVAVTGEETVERPAADVPEEEAAPHEEADGDRPVTGPEEGPGDMAAPAEPESAPEEEVQIAGEFAPELEILPEDGGLTEEEYASGETAQETVTAEHEPWLAPGKGEQHHIYVQKNSLGMAAAEFITRGDIIIASADITYTYVGGMDDEMVAGIAQGFTDVLPAEAKETDAELLWERRGDWLLMVTVLRDLDDSDKLSYYGELGLMRIVDGNIYSLEEAQEFLLSLGYIKEEG